MLLTLGKKVEYKSQYDNSLLYPISRHFARTEIGIADSVPFKSGFDIWNCYEVSWLGARGKPEVRILEFIVPFSSVNIVESKSVKLYLNSFNNTRFNNEDEVLALIQRDLSEAVGLTSAEPLVVKMYDIERSSSNDLQGFSGINLDLLDIELDETSLDKSLLKLSSKVIEVEEVLYSNLLKSNCLVTGQPDWASVQISYKGKQIDHESLLRYIVSFRNHNEFHEQCVERIFTDIYSICAPSALTVYARYTRRGGVDINPIRSTHDLNVTELNNSRHKRQ